MAWDVAAHEQGDGVAVRCHRIFDFPAPNSRREYSHARRSGLEVRNLPLIAKQSVGLRIVARQNFQVSTKRMPDGFRDVPFGIALRLNPNHEIWTVAVMQAPHLMVWVEPERDPEWDIAKSIRHSFRRNLKILSGDYPKPYALFGNQWQIPHFETGAPGMAVFAARIRRGEVKDTVAPNGNAIPLFVRGNIPNHGVLGRAGAAGYLRRVANEMGVRGLATAAVASAAEHMQASSDLFRALRYEADLLKAGELLSQIADHELAALDAMTKAWSDVKTITENAPKLQGMAGE